MANGHSVGLAPSSEQIHEALALAELEELLDVGDGLKRWPRPPADPTKREAENLERGEVLFRIVAESAHPVGPELGEEYEITVRPEQLPRAVDRGELGALNVQLEEMDLLREIGEEIVQSDDFHVEHLSLAETVAETMVGEIVSAP